MIPFLDKFQTGYSAFGHHFCSSVTTHLPLGGATEVAEISWVWSLLGRRFRIFGLGISVGLIPGTTLRCQGGGGYGNSKAGEGSRKRDGPTSSPKGLLGVALGPTTGNRRVIRFAGALSPRFSSAWRRLRYAARSGGGNEATFEVITWL